MADFELIHTTANGYHIYAGAVADTKPVTPKAKDMLIYPSGSIDEYSGTAWVNISTNGAKHVSGLSTNAVIQGAGTYNTTEVLGYRVLVQGSANWAETPVDGTSQAIPFAAQIVGNINPEHLSSITVGTGGSALLYIPA